MVINNGDPVGFPTLETTGCDSRGILKLNQNLVINKSNLDDVFKVDKGAPFATGLYAQVRRCRSLRQTCSQKSQPYYAAKFSPRKRPGHSQNEDCVESLHEIALLCQLKNPYIISFKDAFILDHFIVTIMEFAPGGDLQSVIDADLVLLEKDASRYVYQLLEALKYLHERHIAHLDIKPQNLLLMGEFPSCDIKLCDFEISRVIKPGMEIREILGTPDYVAPEILLYEPLSTYCDMWSVGILTYVLITGFSPFGGDTDQETFRNIINEPIDFPDELFEDVSPEAINFIEKLAVKNSKIRPSAQDIEMHEWVRSYVPPSLIVTCEKEPSPQPVPKEPPIQPQSSTVTGHGAGCGPKKRSPRKASAMSGCSTASASPSGRRISARSILRACKSAYDLNKMGGVTKSREALIEKMRIATGEPSGGPWKLRKNLSKSREQLWESKILLSKSCEKINNNLPGSSRWASVANFPSLDMNTMKSATSQESVISVISTCTNIGHQQQLEMSEWQQQHGIDDGFPYSVPSTPPVPNFDLSQNNGYHESSPPILTNNFSGLQAKMNANGEFSGYPSLNSSTSTSNNDSQYMTTNQATNTTIEEAQKSVAELINTFGGRVSKKLDLKNKFEPIMEVEGSEEQPMSLGDCSDNNSTSGVSSIIASTGNSKDSKNNDQNIKQLNSDMMVSPGTSLINNGRNLSLPPSSGKTDTGQQGEPGSANSSRRNSKTSQQLQDEMRASEKRYNRSIENSRRGSTSPPKNTDGTTLKGILKKPKQPEPTPPAQPRSLEHTFPNLSTNRRGSIPGNCYRLYEQHTISSSAKAPKRSILKNGGATNTLSTDNSKHMKSSGGGQPSKSSASSDRSTSRSPEHSGKQSPPKEDSPVNEGKNENVTVTPSATNNNSTVSQTRPARPTSVLLTSNADNKIDVSDACGRSKSEYNSFVIISPEKEKAEKVEKVFEKELKTDSAQIAINSQKSKQQNKKRTDQFSVESNRFQHQQNISIQVEEASMTTVSGPVSGGDGCEPAAVAIKVFPPDPIIIPKSSVLLLNSSKSPDSPGAEEEKFPVAPEFKEYLKRNASISSTATTSAITTSNKQITQRTQEGIKSQWRTGTGCTGSVERAKERFESVRSKLRRGSVPDF